MSNENTTPSTVEEMNNEQYIAAIEEMKANTVRYLFAVIIFDKKQNFVGSFCIGIECAVNEFYRLCTA